MCCETAERVGRSAGAGGEQLGRRVCTFFIKYSYFLVLERLQKNKQINLLYLRLGNNLGCSGAVDVHFSDMHTIVPGYTLF